MTEQNVKLFANLSGDAMQKLTDLGKVIEAAAGDTIVEESSVGKSLYAISSGRLDVTIAMPDGGRSDPIATLKEGDIFGETVLLGRQRRIARVVARDDAKVTEWDGDQMLAFFKEHPDVGFVVMQNLAAMVHERLTSTNMLLRNTLNQVVEIM